MGKCMFPSRQTNCEVRECLDQQGVHCCFVCRWKEKCSTICAYGRELRAKEEAKKAERGRK